MLLTLLLSVNAADHWAPPASVVEVLARLLADCRRFEGRPRFGSGFETRIDLNGDGVRDQVVDYGAFACPSRLSRSGILYCGTGGCSHDFFVSTPRGYRLAYSGNVRAWSVDRAPRS